MKSLVDSINESLNINEAKAPVFTNDIEGIQAFCDYVFDPYFNKWVVNPDKTITVIHNNDNKEISEGSYACMDTKDLTMIPDFITFSKMENYGLGLMSSSKVKEFIPHVKGSIAKLVFDKVKKLETLNLSDCELNGNMTPGLIIENCTKLKTIVGPKADRVCIRIRKNANLETVNLGSVKEMINGSWMDKNKNLKSTGSTLPKDYSKAYIELDGKRI